ncbi:hypothetical protein MTR67_041922 [Solanum verrucosum]|uniref:Uncharacterized protein n=1 Tax=Solanum verrucosum TaxID=315347 RepID=A0AAF0ZR79_SOLVR|nr:hypothetical protein MTR67_041911 [Solanum verrucosum]WMV48537.1 hypothetical protein MTR67_041922 [Solanum verrucosum]
MIFGSFLSHFERERVRVLEIEEEKKEKEKKKKRRKRRSTRPLWIFVGGDPYQGIVPYSPLGRGFFSAGAKLIEILPDGDFCKRASTGCPYLKSS